MIEFMVGKGMRSHTKSFLETSQDCPIKSLLHLQTPGLMHLPPFKHSGLHTALHESG